MNSVAVWSNKNIELELHINVWYTLKRITWYKKIYDLIKEINANFSRLDWYVDKKEVLEFLVNHKRKIPYNIEFKDNLNFNIANIFLLTNEVYKKILNAKAYFPNFEGWYY